MLVDNRADLNAANENGTTALMVAAKNGRSKKKMMNHVTEEMFFFVLFCSGYSKIIKLLLRSDAIDINAVNHRGGETALKLLSNDTEGKLQRINQ